MVCLEFRRVVSGIICVDGCAWRDQFVDPIESRSAEGHGPGTHQLAELCDRAGANKGRCNCRVLNSEADCQVGQR